MPQLAFQDFYIYTLTAYFSYFIFAFCVLGGIFPFLQNVLKMRIWYNLEFANKTIFSFTLIPSIKNLSIKIMNNLMKEHIKYFNNIKNNNEIK